MRIFPNYPQEGPHLCPVCGTKDEGQTLLVPIDGTQEGDTCEAIPTHLHCVLDNMIYSHEHQLMGLEAKKGVKVTSEE